MMINNPTTNLRRRINNFFASLERRRDRLVRPTIHVIFMMRDRAAALEHRI